MFSFGGAGGGGDLRAKVFSRENDVRTEMPGNLVSGVHGLRCDVRFELGVLREELPKGRVDLRPARRRGAIQRKLTLIQRSGAAPSLAQELLR